MTLGERCDEILRLIDETLCDLAGEDRGGASSLLDASATSLEFPIDGIDHLQENNALCGAVSVAGRASIA